MNAGRGAGIACLVVGGLLAVVGLAAIFNLTTIFRTILSKKVVLSSSSQGYPIWRDVSDYFDTKVGWYFFNLTNPEDVKQGKKPILKEVGPFWYKVDLRKKNIVFNNNKTVTFEEHRRFYFIEEGLPETTKITMLNIPVMALIAKLETMGYFLQKMALMGMPSNESLIMEYTVKELTYNGIHSDVIEFGKRASTAQLFGEVDARFGFAINKNATHPSVFNMFTAATGLNDLNRIYSMGYKHVLDVWPKENNNTCNIVNGSFGYSTAPMNEQKMVEKVYVPDMCRPITLRYKKDSKLGTSDIRTRQFTLSVESFESSRQRAENFCYDQRFKFPSGVTEVGPCKEGAPILMSMPHFMDANASYRDAVEGMNPDPEKHTFIMEHDPMTGMTVSVRGRLQANIRVAPREELYGADHLQTDLTMPLFWQETYVEAGPRVHAFLQKVHGYPGLAKIALVIMILLGLILAIIGAGLLISQRRAQSANLASGGKVNYSKAPRQEGGQVTATPEAAPLM